ncbi:GNAT family N-acetyltransferase [Actinoplanes rectilineatus]|uniref:GNAT family N-acetyltransferase n=1 Tax=Actinoplanes rectilineatus TaxID=113571 RepID=UPI0005F2EFCC|nr:GNAT family protein [Actinoplanes rectilineatus]
MTEMGEPDVDLRPATDGDLWLFQRQAVDPEAGGTFNWSGYRNLAATRQRLTLDGLIGPDDGCLIVWTGGEAVGTVGWRKVHYGTPSWFCWNIGASILPEHRYQGIGTQSQGALVRYLFRVSAAPRVEAYTDVENAAEQGALRRLGFVLEGTLRATQFRDGRWRDLFMYSLTRAEFENSPVFHPPA